MLADLVASGGWLAASERVGGAAIVLVDLPPISLTAYRKKAMNYKLLF
jgi:hypothetical protein